MALIKNLECHMMMHLSKKQSYSPLCDLLPGTGEKTYKCNKCDKPFFVVKCGV